MYPVVLRWEREAFVSKPFLATRSVMLENAAQKK